MMAEYGQYNDSLCAGNPPTCNEWQSIGALAAAIAKKAVQK
ncbi:hypothetical protein Q4543_17700 [Salipiger sp. 1_MG-2023]|nr:hypothetical protein [Salipiger sp. 1_MG-2023]